MPKLKDNNLIGKKFNKLTVVSFNHRHPTHGKSYWNCLCDCGKETVVAQSALGSEAYQGCGCIQRENTSKRCSKPYGYSAMREAWTGFLRSAKEREHLVGLTFEEWHALSQQPCEYCGSKPSNIKRNKVGNGDFFYNGIDRRDSEGDYTVENSAPCCAVCNYMKKSVTIDEFIAHIKKILNHYKN
jgi:hypothetical protein